MKTLLDPAFRYVPSVKTNLRKTFARIRREQAAAAEAEKLNKIEAAQVVRPIKQKEKS